MKLQVTVAHLWVSICFVFQTHEGLAREYTHTKGIVHMSLSGFCVGKGTPRYVDRQKVTINVSQTRETARPEGIKEGFLGEKNLVSTQDSSLLHRTLLYSGLHRFFSSVITSWGDSLPPLLLRGGNGPPSWPWWRGTLLCSHIEKL